MANPPQMNPQMQMNLMANTLNQTPFNLINPLMNNNPIKIPPMNELNANNNNIKDKSVTLKKVKY